jgi:Tol biopolymer transport system component
VFTSHRDGDLDLYLCEADGSRVTRVTDRPGYDGGAFFGWDGRQIVWRGWHPTDLQELAEYRDLLARGLVRPHRAELFVMQADGTAARQVTRNGAANWAPFLHPDGERIVFSSNLHDPGRFDFALYLVRQDGTGLERLTWGETFAAFPMFSRDGSRLVFCSNRGAATSREYNVFVADWVAS